VARTIAGVASGSRAAVRAREEKTRATAEWATVPGKTAD